MIAVDRRMEKVARSELNGHAPACSNPTRMVEVEKRLMSVALSRQVSAGVVPETLPTAFGMTPIELHDRYWLSHGVQVVRQGDAGRRIPSAAYFLLMNQDSLAIFDARPAIRKLARGLFPLAIMRLREDREQQYQEQTLADCDGHFIRVDRIYPKKTTRSARVAITTDPQVAEAWRIAGDSPTAWRALRASISRSRRIAVPVDGCIYERSSPHELMRCVRDLVVVWKSPELSLPHLVKVREGVWANGATNIHPSTRFFGPVWVGAGRHTDPWTTIIGPTVLWDDPQFLRSVIPPSRRWSDMVQMLGHQPATSSFAPLPMESLTTNQPVLYRHHDEQMSDVWGQLLKRCFDLAFSGLALLLTLPFYPLIMLLIYLEDGRPFFFGHRRETRGGKEFLCWKFRSMRKDAEAIKEKLAAQNMADGPQFFMEEDPRLTRIGRLLRKLQVDEWPQFFNVLTGDMSVVGPRPSPHQENQFCPAWREARLSVRPGITGLWQVRRSRAHGLDFQEWIKYDIQYVEQQSFLFDLRIILESILMLARYVRVGVAARFGGKAKESDETYVPGAEPIEA